MKDNTIITDYLKYAIDELESSLIESIKETNDVSKELIKHRDNIRTFKSFIQDEKYLPQYFIDECISFNYLRDKELKLHIDNFSTINKITTLKSNLTWFDGSKKDE